MVKGLAFAMYPVADLQRARRFYENDLGLGPSRVFQEAWVEYDLPGGATFAITTMAEGCSPRSDAASIGLEVENVERVTEELRRKGHRIKLGPMTTPVCRMAVVLDPEGNALTLHQATKSW